MKLEQSKAEHLYSTLHGIQTTKALMHGSHSITCKEHHAYFYLVGVHQMAPLPIDLANMFAAHYSFIDPERM